MAVPIIVFLVLWAQAQARETLVFAHLYTEASLQHQGLLESAQELEQRSGGQIRLEIKPRGIIGDQDSRILAAITLGQADMTFAGGPFAAQDYAPMGLISAPFAFRDFTHWQHFKTSRLARELTADYEKVSGMMLLGFYYNGLRHLNSRTPVRSPEELVGLRVRVPNAPIYLRLFRAMGATPVPTSYEQAYDVLKQGTADAEENPLTTIEDGKFYEVAPYISLTGHITDTGMLLASGKRMRSLSDDQQKLVRDVFGKLAERLTERIRLREVENVEKLKKLGVSFIPIERRALAAKVAPMVEGTDFAWSGDLYDRLQKIP